MVRPKRLNGVSVSHVRWRESTHKVASGPLESGLGDGTCATFLSVAASHFTSLNLGPESKNTKRPENTNNFFAGVPGHFAHMSSFSFSSKKCPRVGSGRESMFR